MCTDHTADLQRDIEISVRKLRDPAEKHVLITVALHLAFETTSLIETVGFVHMFRIDTGVLTEIKLLRFFVALFIYIGGITGISIQFLRQFIPDNFLVPFF